MKHSLWTPEGIEKMKEIFVEAAQEYIEMGDQLPKGHAVMCIALHDGLVHSFYHGEQIDLAGMLHTSGTIRWENANVVLAAASMLAEHYGVSVPPPPTKKQTSLTWSKNQ